MLKIKNLHINIFISILIILFIFFFIFKDEEVKETNQNIIQKELEIETKKEIIQETKIIPKKEKRETIKEEKRDTYITLASFSVDNGKYIVKIVTDKEIENDNDNLVKYIPFRGEFLENEKINIFNFSLDEKYIISSSNINILIDNTLIEENSDDFQCNGNFFRSLNPDNIYSIKIHILGNHADCYMSDLIPMPEKARMFIETMKNITVVDDENNSRLKIEPIK